MLRSATLLAIVTLTVSLGFEIPVFAGAHKAVKYPNAAREHQALVKLRASRDLEVRAATFIREKKPYAVSFALSCLVESATDLNDAYLDAVGAGEMEDAEKQISKAEAEDKKATDELEDVDHHPTAHKDPRLDRAHTFIYEAIDRKVTVIDWITGTETAPWPTPTTTTTTSTTTTTTTTTTTSTTTTTTTTTVPPSPYAVTSPSGSGSITITKVTCYPNGTGSNAERDADLLVNGAAWHFQQVYPASYIPGGSSTAPAFYLEDGPAPYTAPTHIYAGFGLTVSGTESAVSTGQQVVVNSALVDALGNSVAGNLTLTITCP